MGAGGQLGGDALLNNQLEAESCGSLCWDRERLIFSHGNRA